MTDKTHSPAPARENIGAQMANVMFNLAQRAGHTLTSDDAALFDRLRKQWDAATAPAPADAPGVVVGLKPPANGWTGNSDADQALILLDRLDCDVGDDAVRIEQLEQIVRRMASVAPVAADGEPTEETAALLRRLRDAGADYTIEWGAGELYDLAADKIEQLEAEILRGKRATAALMADQIEAAPQAPQQAELTIEQIRAAIRPLCADDAVCDALVGMSLDEYRAVIAADRALRSPGMGALKNDDVKWIVNSLGELGVMIHGQAFFLYKGESLVYKDPAGEDDGDPLFYRPVFKREFGECCHPINYEDPTLVGTVSLDDSDQWRPLPAPLLDAQVTGDQQ